MPDFDEIPKLAARIQAAVDDHDAAAFGDCWMEDAVLRIDFYDRDETLVLNGRAEIVGLATGGWKDGEDATMRHLVGTVSVDPVDANSARVQFYCLYVVPGHDDVSPGSGVYRDLVRWDGGQWRVAKRDHTFFTPIPEH